MFAQEFALAREGTSRKQAKAPSLVAARSVLLLFGESVLRVIGVSSVFLRLESVSAFTRRCGGRPIAGSSIFKIVSTGFGDTKIRKPNDEY